MAPNGGQLLVRTCFSLSKTSMEPAADAPPPGLSVFIRCGRGRLLSLTGRLASAAPQKSRRSRPGTLASLCQGAESPIIGHDGNRATSTGDSDGVRVRPGPRPQQNGTGTRIHDPRDSGKSGVGTGMMIPMILDCRRVPSSRTWWAAERARAWLYSMSSTEEGGSKSEEDSTTALLFGC